MKTKDCGIQATTAFQVNAVFVLVYGQRSSGFAAKSGFEGFASR